MSDLAHEPIARDPDAEELPVLPPEQESPGPRAARPTAHARWAVLPGATRAALLLAGLGLSAVLGAFMATHMAEVPAFVGANTLDWQLRKKLTGTAGAVASLGALVPLLAWLVRPAWVARTESVARRLSPLGPLSFVPMISHWDAWDDRPFVHLCVVAALMFVLHRAVLVALGEPRIVPRWPGESVFGRLAASPAARHLPTGVAFLGALSYAAYFSYYTLLAHDHGRTYAYDLGIFDNLHWQVLHGSGFMRSTPGMGPELSHFGRHATMLAFVFAPIYALHESAETLLVLQATLMGAGAIPLFYFAKRYTTPWAACVLSLAYVAYAPLHGANSYDFHYLSLSPFFVFALAFAVETGKAWAIVLTTALTLACREDVALAVAVVGAYHVLAGTRPRLGLALVVVGGAYFGLMKFVLMPLSEGESSFAGIYQGLMPEGGHGFRGVLTTIASNPTFTFGRIANVTSLTYLLHMVVPVAFLPFRRPLGLLFLAQGVIFTLINPDYEAHTLLSFQYTSFWTPYVFLASAIFLGDGSLRRKNPAVDVRALRRALVCAIAFGAWATSYQWGGLFQHHTMRSGFWPHFLFEPTPELVTRREDRLDILRHIPDDAAVSASETLVPHLSAREKIYCLRDGALYDSEYVLGSYHDLTGPERQSLGGLLRQGEFGVLARNRSMVLLRRGHDTADNAAVHRRVTGRPMPAVDGAPSR